jgi:ubiquinone/menaquinone biosynthesis C-methylase UbiE
MTSNDQSNPQKVNNAFSAQAPLFDGIQSNSPMLEWMRSVVHRHMDEFLKPNDTIVDINAGTGIDALHFARLGHTVHAMDLAAGMVAQIKKKIEEHHLEGIVTTEQRSFTEAGGLAPRKFDHIFSNFGGLNCVPDLRPVAQQLCDDREAGRTHHDGDHAEDLSLGDHASFERKYRYRTSATS